MSGNKKTNINYVNSLFQVPNEVQFIQIEEPKITEIVELLKLFKHTLKYEYESDLYLQDKAEEFFKTLRRIVGILLNYSIYTKANQKTFLNFAGLVKTPKYSGLYNEHVGPILKVVKELLNEERNAYTEKIEELIEDSLDTYIITRHKKVNNTVQFSDFELPIISDSELLERGLFAKHLIFIGTPSYFPTKFSNVFYAEKTTFIGYSCFENIIRPSKSFTNVTRSEELINTFYKNVNLRKGHSGIDYRGEIEKPGIKLTEEQFLTAAANKSRDAEKKQSVQVIAAYISNNNFLFIPVNQKINVIERESYEIRLVSVKDIEVGNLLIFRSQNGADLIREVADDILGDEAVTMRDSLAKWKKRLGFNVDKLGIEKISKILISKYKIKSATQNNIKNWLNPYSIKPNVLEQLLVTLKFDEKTSYEIRRNADEIFRAHISAGHKISKSLMKEINSNFENSIEEAGYYKFESQIFQGASFNVEEIQRLSSDTFFVRENDVLKIFPIKGGIL